MEKTIGYIFGTLKHTEDAIYEINKSLRRQNGVNRRVGVLALAAVAYLYVVDKRHKEEKETLEHRLEDHEKMIDKLNNDIRRLNTLKGEHQM